MLLLNSYIALGAFDFDGNILAPETITYVVDRETGEDIGIPAHKLDQHPELITGAGAQYRWKEDIIDSLVNFRDYHSDTRHKGPDGLKDDIEKALGKHAYSPSMQSLKEVFLVPARIFAIITARGHGPDNLARILWIINESLLSDAEKNEQQENIPALFQTLGKDFAGKPTRNQLLRFYFENIVSYYPVSNPHIAKYLSMGHEKSMAKRKTRAMEHFIQDSVTRILTPLGLEKYPLSIGFSDDSVSNIIAMLNYFEEKRKTGFAKENKIHIYFTGKKESLKLTETPNRKVETSENMITLEL